MKYLGVMVDSGLRFETHLKEAAKKAQGIMNNLGRLLPNLGGPKQGRRKLLGNVAQSVLLYAAPVWAHRARLPRNLSSLGKVQRIVAHRAICAYIRVSRDAAQVLAGTPPADLLALERARVYDSCHGKQLTATQRSWVRIREREQTINMWHDQWDELEEGNWRQWTRTLIPDLRTWVTRRHGSMSYRLTQVMSGVGCFNAYLHGINRATTEQCPHCPMSARDDAHHALFHCPAWAQQRAEMFSVCGTFNEDTMEEIMLRGSQEWNAVSNFAEVVIREKEEAERQRKCEAEWNSSPHDIC